MKDLLCDCVPCAAWFTWVLIEQGRDGREQLGFGVIECRLCSTTHTVHRVLNAEEKAGLSQAVGDCRRSPGKPRNVVKKLRSGISVLQIYRCVPCVV